MNRVVKTALAVTAFGLAAAAMAVPAQADVQSETAAHAPVDGGGTTGASPLGGLLGGLVGGDLLGSLLPGSKAKSAAAPSGQMSEVERDRLNEMRMQQQAEARGNGFEDITRTGGPMPELSPIVSSMPFGGGALTSSLPLLGAARMAQPSVKSGRAQGAAPAASALSTVNGVLASPVGGALGRLPGAGLLPASGSSIADTSGVTAKTVNSATSGLRAVSADSFVAGLSDAAARALPHATSGRLSPVVGRVAPAEVAPVVEAVPGTTQAVAMDELAPLVEDTAAFVATRGTKAAGSYSDVVTALGWTADALTGSVRGVTAHH
ncbi:hypothetical protein [Nonomuraea sp. NPDC049504]|uniref:hypothetical protein n=1 Tax=Nonomuraea sp. NPDC049504 TaxID=3154729 RepID=UPI00344972D2